MVVNGGPMGSGDRTGIYDRLGHLEATVAAQGERLGRVDGKVDRLTEATARIEEKLTAVIDKAADQETRMRRLQRWAWGLPSSVAAAAAAAIAGWKL